MENNNKLPEACGKSPEACSISLTKYCEAFSTKPFYSQPGSTKENPIVIDHESSTKPCYSEPGSTKENPIIIDEPSHEPSQAIRFGELVEDLTDDRVWPASSGQEAEVPNAFVLLDECYYQETERDFHEGKL
jgi:hypothetical protein